MARASWSGAIVFAGFPLPVKAYNLLKSASSDSFKTLCDCHKQPIRAPKVCATTGKEVTADRQLKGVQVAPDAYVALDANTIELSTGKNATIEAAYFAPVDSTRNYIATGVMRLIADPKAAGSEKPVAILWAALRKTNLAMVAENFTARAGSRDSLLVIHAADDGLIASSVPFASDLSDAPASNAPATAVTDAEVAMFEQALGTLYASKDFDRSAHSSMFAERRAKAVESAQSGTPIQAPAGAPAASAVPDLMAALTASLDAVRKPDAADVPVAA